ncbi:hypothetical protein HRI_003858200 [Hibiscus trionum]|uniref:Uncharacterized protein n=1 Tax=Hibiscus trionum TaxID=183268 RepID=A0A9W7ITR6_HIBTR|nr:hypothetical protein HRI_003858200 [Hibiscus trionum]
MALRLIRKAIASHRLGILDFSVDLVVFALWFLQLSTRKISSQPTIPVKFIFLLCLTIALITWILMILSLLTMKPGESHRLMLTKGLMGEMGTQPSTQAVDQRVENGSPIIEDDQDFDDIDNMRIRGDLFYKIDRGSKEFEEYAYDFHRKKGPKNKDDPKESKNKESLQKKDDPKESKRVEKSNVRLFEDAKNGSVENFIDKVEVCSVEKKKVRTPTFNQLTGPYHEPFCLDIYVSKASVRACIIHLATSKVVAVAHSISKDMKFDLGSTRNASACAAVGSVLAQRALDDDIHDVKLKQRRPMKAGLVSTS